MPSSSLTVAPTMTFRRWHCQVVTRLGTYMIATDGAAITGIWREGQRHFPTAAYLGEAVPLDGAHSLDSTHLLLREAAGQLTDYLEARRTTFTLPLRAEGTAFQQRVWAALCTIPRGHTTTYGQIARDLGSPRAAQAVGRAVGSNPLSIAIPCHRVVSAAGALTGYAGGIETKRALLALEGVRTANAPTPGAPMPD